MEKRSKTMNEAIQGSGWLRLSLGLLVLMLSGSFAMAQLTTGNISGTVQDETGAIVPGVDVTITNVATGIVRNTISGDTGRYEAPSLPAGNYEVKATLAGFQTSIRAGITLTVGRTAVVDLILHVGEVAQAVTVTGAAAFVETTTATVSQLVEQQQIEDIPLPARDMMELTFLQPGVLRIPQRNDQRGFSGMGEKMSVAGARGQQNNFLLDGVSNNDISGNPQGASGAYLGAETVQEFQIIINNYSAEYRSQSGAIVSAITKSGTNELHGSAFWTHRNDNLDAARWEDNKFGEVKPEFKRNQFGGSLGGPIVEDQTFFFGSYEGLRERLGETEVLTLLHPSVFTGFVDGEDFGIDQDIARYLEIFPRAGPGEAFPLIKDLGKGEVRSVGLSQTPTEDDFLAIKVDHQFLDNDIFSSVSGTYNYNDSLRQEFGVFGGLGDGSPDGIESTKHVVAANITSVISPTTLNVFRFGYTFSDIGNDIPGITDDFTGLQMHPNRPLMGEIEVGDVDTIGWENLASFYSIKGLNFKDDLSLSYGNHSLRLGGEITRSRFNQKSCSSGCNGAFEFKDAEDFLENKLDEVELHVPGRDTPGRGFSQLGMGVYIQDNWKVRDTLTLNLGLRYEFVTVPKEDNDFIANLVNFSDSNVSVPASIPALFPEEQFAGTIDDFYTNATLKSFSPRLGFAWAPGSRKFSLRGGIGIFYDHPGLYHIRTSMQELFPYSVVGEPTKDEIKQAYKDGLISSNQNDGKAAKKLRMWHKDADGLFMADVFAPIVLQVPNARIPTFQQKNGTIYRWSLTLQQELSDWVFSAGYTGSRALHLWVQNNSNLRRWKGWPDNSDAIRPKQWGLVDANGDEVDLGPLVLDLVDDGDAFLPDRINSRLGELRSQSPQGNSFYHGLALGAQKRLSRGLRAQISYNLSKATDNGAGLGNNTENLPQGLRGIYHWDMRLRKALSAQDIRHSLVSNFTYALPSLDLGGFGGQILNGWKINGILSFVDGTPLNLVDDSSAQELLLGDRSNMMLNLIPGGNNNPVLGTPSEGHEFYYDVSQFIPAVCRAGVYCYENEGEVDSRGFPIFTPDPDNKDRPKPDPSRGYNPGFFGQLGQGTLTSPGLATIDFSILKDFNVTENNRIQFRAEFFNLFNRPNFGTPQDEPFDKRGEPEYIEAGEITDTFTSARQMQFSLKFLF